MAKNIVLIGFMGTGKTSVGAALAKRLGRVSHDIDAMIEADQRKKIAQLFEERGEDHFRRLEKDKIREAAALDGAVITTGGGAVMDPENVERLKKNGVMICLSASSATILKRVGRSKNRPLLKNAPDPQKAIEELLARRRAQYEQAADVTVATDGKTAEQVAAQIEVLLDETKLLGECP
jgi:shikimate kinase